MLHNSLIGCTLHWQAPQDPLHAPHAAVQTAGAGAHGAPTSCRLPDDWADLDRMSNAAEADEAFQAPPAKRPAAPARPEAMAGVAASEPCLVPCRSSLRRCSPLP